MRALVVGFGSIGQRHARVLASMGLEVAVVTKAAAAGLLPRHASVEAALAAWKPDYVVVANRTAEHLGALESLGRLGYRGLLLVEKPLLDGVAPLPPGLPPLWAGYNLRCHPLIEAVRAELEAARSVGATLAVGQYLPSWRPAEDYRKGYSARRDQGGGVVRDLSHELDLLVALFGGWRSVVADFGHFSELEIDSEDLCAALVRTVRCPLATVTMDYLDRQPRREIVVHTTAGSLHANLVAGTLSYRGSTRQFDVERDHTYREQHRRILEGDTAALCDAAQAQEVMGLIQAIERSQQEGTWVHHD